MTDALRRQLAQAAGLVLQWTDAAEQDQQLDPARQRHLLDALQLPSGSAAECRESLQLLQLEALARPELLTADAGQPLQLPAGLVLSAEAGWQDEQGQRQPLQRDQANHPLAPVQPGYYQLDLPGGPLDVAVAPPRCYGVADVCADPQARRWGLALQVYALARAGDGGLGDHSAVAELAEHAARHGADALGLSPLHASSPIVHGYSPYSPSHRGFLNPLHADAQVLFGEAAWHQALVASGQAQAWQTAAQPLIDWPAQARMRRAIWQQLFAQSQQALAATLHAFEQHGGAPLRAHALIAARQAWAVEQGQSTSWLDWEAGWAERSSAIPGFFAAAHPQALAFEVFLQWAAAQGWSQTQRRARESGMAIGLIADLAVGFEPGGGEAWRHRDLILQGISLGAPPDAFNADGQQWGITSYSPRGLRRSGFAPFIELLRANMALGGGIRIDHILGLNRLWVVPQGGPASAGGYLRYPLQDLLRLVALESWRHRCIVIGEDLGTVPADLRALLAQRGVMGTDVLLFNRDAHGAFLPPGQWRDNALATTTTHDLPPLAGWRRGLDIDWRAKLQQWPENQRQAEQQHRQQEVSRLQQALAALPAATPPAESTPALDWSALRFVALSRAPLVLVPMEDALGLDQQPNLPGTVDDHPNWRRRLPSLTPLAPAMAWLQQQRLAAREALA